MATLLLMRHAKSDYPDGVVDHERPLAPRGVREAALAGDWIRANAPGIDAVLCSTATRTRQTLARTGIDAPTEYVEKIYDAVPGTVIGEINDVVSRFGTQPDTVLVVGHEPAMSSVASASTTVRTSRWPRRSRRSSPRRRSRCCGSTGRGTNWRWAARNS